MAVDFDAPSLTLRVNAEIAKTLMARESSLTEELEQATRKYIIIQSDPTLHRSLFGAEKIVRQSKATPAARAQIPRAFHSPTQ
jgi:hypothetical protein